MDDDLTIHIDELIVDMPGPSQGPGARDAIRARVAAALRDGHADPAVIGDTASAVADAVLDRPSRLG